MKKIIVLCIAFAGLHFNASSQAFDINDFFSDYTAITFYTADSNNFILDEITNYDDLKKTIAKECPFSIYNAEHLENIVPFNVFTPILGLHNQIPWYDTVLQEVKGTFSIDTFVKNWYGYYNKSVVDTTTAFLIIPGYGIHDGWHIAAGDTAYYMNRPMPIKDKCLQHGDVYAYAKPNEDYRSIWKKVGGDCMKLDYNYFTPYTDMHGINWAANMTIECTAIVKCLKLRYNKVIVLGLSNAGLVALIAGMEGGADGVNCASGLSTTDYDGFPLTNYENPYYYNELKKYCLDSIKSKMANTSAYYLFSYGDGDASTNLYEYTTHSLQDTFSTLPNNCRIEFTYNFYGHHYPIAYLDTFIQHVKNDSCPAVPLMVNNINKPNDNITIYPNPAQKKLIIKSDASDIQSVQVYSLTGEEILFRKNIQALSTTIYLPALSQGNYIVNVMTKNKNYAKLVSIVQ